MKRDRRYAQISHSILTSDRLVELLDHPEGPAAFGLWSFATTFSSDQLLDGRVPIYLLLAFARSPEKLDALIGALEASELAQRDGRFLILADYLQHNRSREQVEGLSEKRSKAGALGGSKQKRSKTKAKAKPPVVVDVVVDVADQGGSGGPDQEPLPPPESFASVGAKPAPTIRGTLIKSWGEAWEARYQSLAVGVTPSKLDGTGAVHAVEHFAQKHDRDPLEVARDLPRRYLRDWAKPKPPAFHFFAQAVGELLAEMADCGAVAGPRRPAKPAKPIRIVDRDGSVQEYTGDGFRAVGHIAAEVIPTKPGK